MNRRNRIVWCFLLSFTLFLVLPNFSAAYCQRCVVFCPPPFYQCEYACEIINGFCFNCFIYCNGGFDYCYGWTACDWAHAPRAEDPEALLLAEITMPETGFGGW